MEQIAELTEFEQFCWRYGGLYSTKRICEMKGVTREEVSIAYDRAFEYHKRDPRKVDAEHGEWTQEETEEIVRLYNEGLTYPQIAAKMGKRERQVAYKVNWLRDRKMIGRRNYVQSRFTNEEVETMKRLYVEEKIPPSQIAVEIGHSERAISDKLKLLGLWRYQRNG